MNGELMSPYSPTSLENQNAQAQDSGLLQNGEDGSSGDDKFSKTSGSPNRTRLSALTSRAKAKTRKLIHPDGAAFAGDSDTDEGGVLDGLERNAAFHTSDLVKKKRFRPGKTADKTLNNIKSLGKAVVHPVDSIKSKATRTTAGQLSKAERPFLSQNADKEYLEAHDNLKRAESTGSSKRGTSDEDQESTIGDHREKLREIEAHRESLQVAWTTSRHIRRARVVPKHHIDFPKIDSFIERDEYGKMRRIDWLKWLGHVRHHVWLLAIPLLTKPHRISFTILKILAPSTLMILINCLSTSIAADFMPSDSLWLVHPGNHGQWTCAQCIDGKTPGIQPDGLASIWCCGTRNI